MQNVGLEPTRLAAQEPKSCMSANSINSANLQHTDMYYITVSVCCIGHFSIDA